MSIAIAQQFATLIDNTRFDEAMQLTDEQCKYRYSEGKYQGRSNIINIYIQNHLQYAKLFDEITYTSEVEALGNDTFKIQFLDSIRKGHKWHRSKSFQIIIIKDNHIVEIEHCEIPGEMESLREFYSRYR